MPAAESWLLPAELATFLKPRAASCRLLRGKLTWRTFRYLEKLWLEKRAELCPENPDMPFTNGVGRRGLRFSHRAAEILLAWLTMPAGHYGTKEKPRRDLKASAQFVGCTEPTIRSRLKGKEIWDWSRSGKGRIRTYTVAHLQELKGERARDGLVILKELAEQIGRDVQRSRRLVGQLQELGLLQDGVKVVPIREGGNPTEAVTKRDAAEIVQMVERAGNQQRPDGWSTQMELWEAVRAESSEAESAAVKLEVSECLNCWEQIGLLTAKTIEQEIDQERRNAVNGVLRSRLLPGWTLWKTSEFMDLWKNRCKAKVGAEHLKILLPFGTQKPHAEIADEMKRKGFVGRRLDEAKRLAGVITHYRPGSHPPDVKICERIDPKKKPVDPLQVLKAIFAGGWKFVKDYEGALDDYGLSRRQAAMIRAEEELAYTSKPIGALPVSAYKARGINGKGKEDASWVCWLQGQAPPTEQELKAMRKQGQAAVDENRAPTNGQSASRPVPPSPVPASQTVPVSPKASGEHKKSARATHLLWKQWHEEEGLSLEEVARRHFVNTGKKITRSAVQKALERLA